MVTIVYASGSPMPGYLKLDPVGRERRLAHEVLDRGVGQLPGRRVVVVVHDRVDATALHQALRARVCVERDDQRLVREGLARVLAGHGLTCRLAGGVERDPDRLRVRIGGEGVADELLGAGDQVRRVGGGRDRDLQLRAVLVDHRLQLSSALLRPRSRIVERDDARDAGLRRQLRLQVGGKDLPVLDLVRSELRCVAGADRAAEVDDRDVLRLRGLDDRRDRRGIDAGQCQHVDLLGEQAVAAGDPLRGRALAVAVEPLRAELLERDAELLWARSADSMPPMMSR